MKLIKMKVTKAESYTNKENKLCVIVHLMDDSGAVYRAFTHKNIYDYGDIVDAVPGFGKDSWRANILER